MIDVEMEQKEQTGLITTSNWYCIYLHVVIGNTYCIMTMYDGVIIGGNITIAREYTSEKGALRSVTTVAVATFSLVILLLW